MDTLHDALYGPVTSLAEAIRRRQISVVEVVESYLQRIEAVNTRLNAVVALDAEGALAQARDADTVLAQGDTDRLGPLHGVPMTIKDSFDTAGMVSTWGTPGRADAVPIEDATVVARLKSAGAILLGKTNTPELTLSFETHNPIHGRTNNPYDLERAPGGSSGGSAALVAVGAIPFDIGTDTGGSIRIPAHCCGITGLKPTTGRVPRTGHAISPIGWLNSLTQPGPLARYVDDLHLLLSIIAGPDGRDPTIAPVPLRSPQAVSLPDLRAAFFTDNGIRAATPDVTAIVQQAVSAVEAAGVSVTEARPPGIEESLELLGKLMRGADGGEWVRRILNAAGTRPEESSLTRYLTVETPHVDGMVAIIERWDRFRQQMLTFLDDYDVIISPVVAFPALPHGTFAGDDYPGFSYTMPFNLTGWPAVAVPAGLSSTGLPVGVQIAAAPWREDIALAVARQVEAALGGWQMPPAFV